MVIGLSGPASASPAPPRQVVKDYIGDINAENWAAGWKLLSPDEHRINGSRSAFADGLRGTRDQITYLGSPNTTGDVVTVPLRMTSTQGTQVHDFSLVYHLDLDGSRWLIEDVGLAAPNTSPTTAPSTPPASSYASPAPQITLTNPDDLYAALEYESQELTGTGINQTDLDDFIAWYHQQEIAYQSEETNVEPPTPDAGAYAWLEQNEQTAIEGYNFLKAENTIMCTIQTRDLDPAMCDQQ